MQALRLSGFQKAAVLLIAMGSDLSAKVLKQEFQEGEMESLTKEISNLTKIPVETKNEVLKEFVELWQAREYMTRGGSEYAKELLEKTLGRQKASEIMLKLTANMNSVPFSMLRKTDPKHLLNFIRDEHPQTIALILSHLTPDQAAIILESLPAETQVEISRRVAIIERFSPDIVREVELVLENKISSIVQEQTVVGGIQALVDVLNRVGRSAEKVILEGLERRDPELAEEVKRRMFVFEDIIILPDNYIQRVLKEIDSKELALAMRGANEEVNSRIYKNMSSRASDMLKEEIEYMGPVRLRDVEMAQHKIVTVIRKLDESGEIIISRGEKDAII